MRSARSLALAMPANRMPYAGMASASDRNDLIAYLQKAAK